MRLQQLLAGASKSPFAAAVSLTDLPMVVGTGYFRQTGDRFYIPIAMAVPGFAVPVAEGTKQVLLDVRTVCAEQEAVLSAAVAAATP